MPRMWCKKIPRLSQCKETNVVPLELDYYRYYKEKPKIGDCSSKYIDDFFYNSAQKEIFSEDDFKQLVLLFKNTYKHIDKLKCNCALAVVNRLLWEINKKCDVAVGVRVDDDFVLFHNHTPESVMIIQKATGYDN